MQWQLENDDFCGQWGNIWPHGVVCDKMVPLATLMIHFVYRISQKKHACLNECASPTVDFTWPYLKIFSTSVFSTSVGPRFSVTPHFRQLLGEIHIYKLNFSIDRKYLSCRSKSHRVTHVNQSLRYASDMNVFSMGLCHTNGMAKVMRKTVTHGLERH